MSATSGAAILALTFVPMLWIAVRKRRQALVTGASQRPLQIAAFASFAALLAGLGLAVSNGAFG